MSDRKLRAWQAAGLIDADTAARIRDWEAAHARPLVLWAVIGIGALAVGLGLVSVVAANWDDIPGMVRLTIHFLVMAGLAGWLCWREPGLSRDNPGMHEAGLFVLAMLGLTFMGHLGQVYQTSSPLWQPVGLWLLLFAPLLLGRGLGWLSAALFMAGSVLAGANYALESEMAGNGLYVIDIGQTVGSTLAVGAPVLLAGIAAQARNRSARGQFWRRLGQIALVYGLGGASLIAIASLAGHGHGNHILAAATTASLLGLASAALLWLARKDISDRAAAGIVAGAATVPALAFMLEGDATIAALLFMALWAGVAAAALHAGWRAVFQLAVGVIALRLIVLSFELAGDLLTSGAGLIASGLLILAIAWGAVRVSRRFAPRAAEHAP